MSIADGRGRWYRYSKKALDTDYLRLHVRDAQRWLDLTHTSSSTLTWRRNGQQIGALTAINVPARGVLLVYSSKGESIEELIRWDITTPHYGGQRRWWLCPRCGRRCAVLYGGPRFWCRLCHNLTYKTTQGGGKLIDTIDNRLSRLCDLLQAGSYNYAEYSPPPRPPTMHSRTYWRLAREWHHLHGLRENCLNLELVAMVRGLPGMDDQTKDLDLPEVAGSLRKEWRQRRERQAADPDPYYWQPEPEERTFERFPPERYTLGELATAAGVPYEFAQEAQHADLLRPDGGRGTRVRRYRPRLATWLRKLHTLRQAGYTWDAIHDWTARRFTAGHEHERRWPADFTPPPSSS